MSTLEPYQQQFIQFLVACEVLTFGDFTTKSGRKTPYFVNTGRFNSGRKIDQLGQFYAQHAVHHQLQGVTSIFGPAYKGVPLCVATASALHRETGSDIGFTFNRKEAKGHGDKGIFVGHQLQKNDSVVIVEDVITAGTTLKEIVPLLREQSGVSVDGVIIAVDRCERGSSEQSARAEVEQLLDIKVFPLVTVHQVKDYLSQANPSGFTLDGDLQSRMDAYLEEYGAV